MSAPSKRIFTAASRVPAYNRSAESLQGHNAKLSTTWICARCCHRSLFSPASKLDRSPLKEPIGRLLKHQRNQIRNLTSSRSRRDDEKFRSDLPSAEEGRRSHASKRFDHVMDNIQSNIFIAGQRLNDLTGYSGIEALRKEIEQQEQFVRDTRLTLQRAREAYTKAISQRSNSQREVNELLQRKHAWSPTDLERFTELYRSDHANEQAESVAQQELADVEKTAEEAAAQLSKSILSRYHEEQIWSDKIRRMSTWGTWGLMGVNVLLFLIFQIGVEPWRRKRLVKGFEEKVMEALEREGNPESKTTKSLGPADGAVDGAIAMDMRTEEQSEPTEALTSNDLASNFILEEPNMLSPEATPSTIAPNSATPPITTLDLIVKRIQDLFSDRKIAVRQLDVTAAAIEGAAAGAALTGLLLLLLRPR